MTDASNPFRKKPFLRRLGLALAVIAAFVGWFAYELVSQRPGVLPSSFFQQLDENNDRAVSFSEWTSYYEQRLGWQGHEWDFRFMDCNDDQRLSWGEYRAWRFRRESCGKGMNIADRPRAPGSFSICETDPVNHVQTCYVGSSSGKTEGLPAGPPMKELKIPQ
jgi:hypothetical protein